MIRSVLVFGLVFPHLSYGEDLVSCSTRLVDLKGKQSYVGKIGMSYSSGELSLVGPGVPFGELKCQLRTSKSDGRFYIRADCHDRERHTRLEASKRVFGFLSGNFIKIRQALNDEEEWNWLKTHHSSFRVEDFVFHYNIFTKDVEVWTMLVNRQGQKQNLYGKTRCLIHPLLDLTLKSIYEFRRLIE